MPLSKNIQLDRIEKILIIKRSNLTTYNSTVDSGINLGISVKSFPLQSTMLFSHTHG